MDPFGLLTWNGTIVHPTTGPSNTMFAARVAAEVRRILDQIGISSSFTLMKVFDTEIQRKQLFGIPIWTSGYYMRSIPGGSTYNLDRSLGFLKTELGIPLPILIPELAPIADGGIARPRGIAVEFDPDVTMIARIIVHELFHVKTGFRHYVSFAGWNKPGYLTAQEKNKTGYKKPNKEIISCEVADWITKNGGKPNPKWVEPGWGPKP